MPLTTILGTSTTQTATQQSARKFQSPTQVIASSLPASLLSNEQHVAAGAVAQVKLASAAKAITGQQATTGLVGASTIASLSNAAKTLLSPPKPPVLQQVFPSPRPDLRAEVDIDKHKGIIDCFYARLVFRIPSQYVASGKVKAIRVFRAVVDAPLSRAPGRMSLVGVDRIASKNLRTRSKFTDPSSAAIEHRLQEAGVDNVVSALLPIDPALGVRRATSADSLAPTSPSSNPIDTNVAQDPKTIRNLQTAGAGGTIATENIEIAQTTRELKPLATSVPTPKASAASSANVNAPDLGFNQVAYLLPNDLVGRTVGDLVEYIYDDPTIVYQKSYSFYVSTVDPDMRDGPRSQVVTVIVDGLRVPDAPASLTTSVIQNKISLHIGSPDDALIEKYEIYRKEDLPPADPDTAEVLHVGGRSGFAVQTELHPRNANGFVLLGETPQGNGGATFLDRGVLPGLVYHYRVYTVDVFGNKSESPAAADVLVSDAQARTNDLGTPALTAEFDPGSRTMNIGIACDDPRVKAVFLERRDLTSDEHVFRTPGGGGAAKFGAPSPIRGPDAFVGPRLDDADLSLAWNGYFAISPTSPASFKDHSVSIDRVYQYRVRGIDSRGLDTPWVRTLHIGTLVRQTAEAPFALSAQVSYDPTSSDVLGVTLAWQSGSNTIASEDLLGNRAVLGDTIIRALYQVERRMEGEANWQQFQMVDSTSFFDPLIGSDAALAMPTAGRPEFVRLNERYNYRVKTMLTGGFVSSYSDVVDVYVALALPSPKNFTITTPDQRISPFYTMLNWDTDSRSGVVDRWEIERMAANYTAAAMLQSAPSDAFLPFKTIFAESSRFRANVLDSVSKDPSFALPDGTTPTLDRTGPLATGQHQYMDGTAVVGNAYRYRIRAVGVGGEASEWSETFVVLTPLPESKFLQAVTPSLGPILDTIKPTNAFSMIPSQVKALAASSVVSSLVTNINSLQPLAATTPPVKELSISSATQAISQAVASAVSTVSAPNSTVTTTSSKLVTSKPANSTTLLKK